jgi:isoquinoline 1-oxidoreductase alpha subunit
MAITLNVNGTDHEFDGDISMPVLWFVRDILGLHGTKYGCGTGQCGACTVHIDGVASRACVLSVEAAAGRKITTIEGLDPEGNHPVQKAWRVNNVPQCGYCQSGQIMNAAAFISENPEPSAQQIDAQMSGNICRCGCYQRIHEAVAMAALDSQEG